MSQTPDAGNPFQPLVAAGYPRLLPVIPPGAQISPHSKYLSKRVGTASDPRGKAPGVLNGDGGWHGINFTKVQSSPELIQAWHEMGAGCGVRTGSGLAALDVDTIDGPTARRAVGIIEQELGLVLAKRYGRRPKVLMPIRVAGEFGYQNVKFLTPAEQDRLRPGLVELLAEGRHFVASGIHPVTGRPYEWPDGIPAYDDLPVIPAAALKRLFARLALELGAISHTSAASVDREAVNQAALRAPVEQVRAAVEATPNTTDAFPSRDDWLQMGYAIKAACGSENEHEALEIWSGWSDRWDEGENDRDELEANWDRMKPPYGIGAGWIFDRAHRVGGWLGEADRWFSPLPVLPPEDRDPLSENPFLAKSTAGSASSFSFKDFATLARDAIDRAARPLVKGLLDCGALSCLYGDSNVGKTFVAMDVAYHISRGWRWAGLKVAQANVLYVAAEGGGGVAKRVRVLMDLHGDPGAAFDVLPQGIDLLDPDADVGPLIAALAGGKGGGGVGGKEYGLVVLDTLARVMAGGDENAAQDMGALIRNVDRVRRATGAHVMLIHHTGKKVENGARGSSALRAALDTELLVADRMVTATKQRDLDGTWACGFDLEVRALGIDAEGDVVSSCIVRIICENAFGKSGSAGGAGRFFAGAGGGKLTEAQQDVLGAVEAAASVDLAGASIATLFTLLGGAMAPAGIRGRLAELSLKRFVLSPKRGRYVPRPGAETAAIADSSRKSVLD